MNKSSWKFLIAFVAIILLVLGGYWIWNNRLSPAVRDSGEPEATYEKAIERQEQLETSILEQSGQKVIGSSNDQRGVGLVGDAHGQRILSKQAAVDEYWDEIKYYLVGTETISAFSYESGSYYLVKASISDGSVKKITFSNGSSLYFWAEFGRDGHASEIDLVNGSAWDFQLDMDSVLVKRAVDIWASSKGLVIE